MNTVLLPCRFLAAMTTALLLMISLSASAQTTSRQSDGKQTLVATVFGEPFYLEQFTPSEAETKRKEISPAEFDKWLCDFQAARLYENIWGAVSRKYKEREIIDVSEEELAAIKMSVERSLKSVSGGPNESPIPSVEQKGIAVAFSRASLMDWKVCKSLYEKYGGRVGIGSLGAWTALDAQHALLKEHHKAGDITFHQADIETAFWEYSRREHFADAY
ncbi:MAG: hypothetical protein KDA78_17700, partial [Planctomycetaceae bacterium]|nr:hypothetical protein [Planctomycetaceae bacterium]